MKNEKSEKALEKLIKYIHADGIGGCPYNCDCTIISDNKEQECILCDFQFINNYELNCTELEEYNKKSCECWKEWCYHND